MAKFNDAQHYDFSTWQAPLVGKAPTSDLLHTVHMLGLRPGKQALANAMALRPQGVTGSEIVIACGAPQLNRMRGLIADGVVKREAVAPRNGHTVYKLSLTPKGQARVAKAEAAPKPDTEVATPAKAPKVKAKRTRKAKPAPAATPAVDPQAQAAVDAVVAHDAATLPQPDATA